MINVYRDNYWETQRFHLRHEYFVWDMKVFVGDMNMSNTIEKKHMETTWRGDIDFVIEKLKFIFM